MKRFFTALMSLLVATSTAAAATAYVTTDLNLRRSPDTRFRPITVLPAGALVDVRGCVRSYRWCRVSWRGLDGWAYSRYLATRQGPRYRDNFDDYALSIGIPIIAGIIIGSTLGDRHHYHRRYDRRSRYDRRRYYDPRGRYDRRSRYDRRKRYYWPRTHRWRYEAPNSHESGDLW